MRRDMGIKVYRNSGAVLNNLTVFSDLGGRVLIVTSRTAGEKSGALQDVRTALDTLGIKYSVHDSVKPNPDLKDCLNVACSAREFGADSMIGIGGGSPLDVVKIASFLAVNDVGIDELTDTDLVGLPFILVPTTAGSGSETTRYAVILDHEKQSKKTVASDNFYPVAIFLDGRYTERLPLEITRYTALDALSHLVEGYINNKANEESDAYAIEGLRTFGKSISSLVSGDLGTEDRMHLLDASYLGGRVIDTTRSNIPHVMGYQLTYKYGVPHGEACALFLAEFLRLNERLCGKRIKELLAALGMDRMDEFEEFVSSLTKKDVAINDEEIEKMIPVFTSYATISNSPVNPSRNDLFLIAKNSVGDT